MENGTIVVAQPAERLTGAKRRAAKQERRAKANTAQKIQDVRTAKGAGSAIVKRVSTNSNQPSERFHAVFGPSDLAFLKWLRTIHDPTGPVSGVPAAIGSFQLYTELWVDGISGLATADSNGALWIGVAVDSWQESGNATGVPDPFCRVMGYATPGNMAISTNGSVAVGGTIAGVGGAFTGLAGHTMTNPGGTEILGSTRVRQVASRLRVWHTQPNNTAQGEMMIVSSVNPLGPSEGGLINSMDWSGLVASNPATMSRYTVSLANWKPDEVIEAVAIPAEEAAFETYIWPSSGYTAAVPIFTMACMARGLVPGSKVEFRIDTVFESESGKTKRAPQAAIPEPQRTYVPVSTLLTGASNSVKVASRPSAVSTGIHSLPFVESLATTNPMGLAALDHHPSMAPVHAAAKTRPAEIKPYRPASGGILDAVKGVGTSLVKSGVLGMIPYAGPVIQGLASGLMRIFG